MASITAQRDLVLTLKRETLLNVGVLNLLQPMSSDLSVHVFKNNALEKPTQNIFNHLTHYLVSIIDPNVSTALPWPLYDSKIEKSYRNGLSVFISNYNAKGLLSPVMSSYLVNPGGYKVTLLIFQVSQLAVQKVLEKKMHKEHQNKRYMEITEQYKREKEEGFIDGIEKEIKSMRSKFSNYLKKRELTEKAAALLRKAISHMEETLECSKAQEYINKLVDNFIKEHKVNNDMKNQLLKVKNVRKKSQVFDDWLTQLDCQIKVMGTEWDDKMSSFLSICLKTANNSEALIARHTGDADRRSFAMEYNQKTDEICTTELQSLVNSHQKYILKNIAREERLNFPNLIRGFLISICFILKNTDIDSNIDVFNEYLEDGRRSYAEVVAAMKILVEQVMNAESRLSPLSEKFNMSVSVQELTVIPPLPDLSDLKINKQCHPQMTYDAFTPLNITKHQFNLQRKVSNNNSFIKPLPKLSLITPFHHKSNRDDFLRSVISAYDQQNTSINIHNMSTISYVSKMNETVSECPGFTRQQIFRLLSTRKSTSTKKFKHKYGRPNIHVVKGHLFNESVSSNETLGLYRSHSSPNLFDNRDRRSIGRNRARKLSIMKEGSPSQLEVSGIAVLERGSNHSTPQGQDHISLEGFTQNHLAHSATVGNTLNTALIPSETTSVTDDLVKDLKNVTLEESSTVLNQQNEPVKIIITQWKSTDNIPEQKNIEVKFKNSENIQREAQVTGNIPMLRKSQIPRKTADKIHVTHRSTENLQKECKSTDFILKERKSTENEIITKGSCIEKIEKQSKTTATDHKSIEFTKDELKVDTPPPKKPFIKKTSSIEKIMNRFWKVRASMHKELNIASTEDSSEFNAIVEEKENNTNINTFNLDVFSANRVLLPDLLSPSCSIHTHKAENFMELLDNGIESDEVTTKSRRPRESLGATLGVDHTFLDQFDLSD